MILRFSLLLAMMLTWSCSGDDAQQAPPKEPVAAEQKIPDNPGESGESANAKPAGAGQAIPDSPGGGQPEKSTPPPAAAAAAAAAPAPAAAAPVASAAGDKVVTAGALNVRNGAGTKHDVVRTLKRGEHVSPMSCTKGWCKLAEGQFVAEKYLSAPQ